MLMHDVMQHVGHLIGIKIKHTHAQVVLMRGEFRLGGGVGVHENQQAPNRRTADSRG